jgi:hypothetical protein
MYSIINISEYKNNAIIFLTDLMFILILSELWPLVDSLEGVI